MNLQDLLGSLLLADIDLIFLGLLRGTSVVVVILVKGHAFSTVGIKRLLSAVEVTAASYKVTTSCYDFYCCTQKFIDQIGELRAISGHMLGADGVQMPENISDDLHSSREEDGTLETMNLQDLLGSLFFGVDATMEIKEKHQVFTAGSEDISVVGQKLMLLVTAVK
nr:hypothetical protein [Tanacetum cinerariifolium]